MYYTNIKDYEQLLSHRQEDSCENENFQAITIELVTVLLIIINVCKRSFRKWFAPARSQQFYTSM